MRRDVLILTDEQSPTVEGVQSEIERRGARAAVIAVSTLPSLGRVALGDGPGEIRSGGIRVNLSRCLGVWSWHPDPPRVEDEDPETARYVRNEWRLAVLATAAHVERSRWVNDPAAASWIEGNKLLQQRLAQAVGLRAPKTLVSNDPATIDAFAAQHESVAVKSQGGIRREHDADGFKTAFTQRCSREELRSAARSLTRAPVVVQPYIEKAFEVRATVVDGDIHACQIDSQASSRTATDWRRYDFANVSHAPYEFDKSTAAAVRRLMERTGLRYAALDFIATPGGELFFHDLNPSGQFGWIEGLTGAPITASIVDALLCESATRQSPLGPST